ncbi:MAG TPA: glycosyltransferase [Puia sp.]|nr:glycosyltransferase [Puia sp.]
MKKNYDIICLSLVRWESEIQSPATWLVRELAKTNRVFYINHPLSLKDFVYHKFFRKEKVKVNEISSPEKNIVVATPNLTLPINFLPNGRLYNWLKEINNKIVAKSLRRLIKEFNITNFVYINFFDPYFLQHMPKGVNPVKTIYQSMDDISQVAYSKRHGERLEIDVMQNSDIVLCTSRELTRLKKEHAKNVYFHPNGVDSELFKKAALLKMKVPDDLAGISKKIIGYVGSIEYRMDFELVKKIAEAHRDKILFFIGPVSSKDYENIDLSREENLVFAGGKKVDEILPYLQHFDCVIVPFKKNVLTRSIYPLKINEYLAAGKPVITTNFSEDINAFREVAYVANSDEEFIQLIDKAIENNDEEKKKRRIEVAEQNSWQVRAREFWEILENNSTE